MSGVDHLPWWKTGRELGLFVVGAIAGALLPPDDSSIWLGVPVLAIVAVWVYLWRVNARARLSTGYGGTGPVDLIDAICNALTAAGFRPNTQHIREAITPNTTPETVWLSIADIAELPSA